MMHATTKALDDLTAHWRAIDAARESAGIINTCRPVGAFTLGEYCEKYRVAATTGSGELRRLITAGKMTRVRFRGITSDGKSQVFNGYQAVKPRV
jgi:hypothetical protein